MKKRVYLAGNISSDPETYRWREKAEKILEIDYIVLNPAANAFNKRLLKQFKEDSDNFLKAAIERSQRILIIKDFNLVKGSDIVLFNLSIITPEKPPLATIFELAWSWYLQKPIIAITGDNLYSKHPFCLAAFSATSENVEGACQLIKDFFEE